MSVLAVYNEMGMAVLEFEENDKLDLNTVKDLI